MALDTHTKKINPLSIILGGVHGKVCWLIAYLLWGISREEIFENLLRLMRFGVYFETKMAIFIKKNNYSLFALICARGSGAYAT